MTNHLTDSNFAYSLYHEDSTRLEWNEVIKDLNLGFRLSYNFMSARSIITDESLEVENGY